MKSRKQKHLEKQMLKIATQVFNTIGFIFIGAFAVLGAFFYYYNMNGNLIDALLLSVVVILFLFIMANVTEDA